MQITNKMIREDLFCGDCINCKLMVWNKNRELSGQNKSYLATKEKLDEGNDKMYLVRCTWLKDNVLSPKHLTSCEGKIKQGENNQKTTQQSKQASEQAEQNFSDSIESVLGGL